MTFQAANITAAPTAKPNIMTAHSMPAPFEKFLKDLLIVTQTKSERHQYEGKDRIDNAWLDLRICYRYRRALPSRLVF